MDPIVVRDWFHQLPSPRNKISNKRNEFVWLQNQISKHHKNHVIERRCVLIWIYLMHISGSLIAFIQKWTPLIRNFDQLTNFWFNSWWKVRGRYFFPEIFIMNLAILLPLEVGWKIHDIYMVVITNRVDHSRGNNFIDNFWESVGILDRNSIKWKMRWEKSFFCYSTTKS